MNDAGCGGCRGEGSHRRHCTNHPDYHPWRVLADMAEDIGDRIGGTDTGLANRAYGLAGAIREEMPTYEPSVELVVRFMRATSDIPKELWEQEHATYLRQQDEEERSPDA